MTFHPAKLLPVVFLTAASVHAQFFGLSIRSTVSRTDVGVESDIRIDFVVPEGADQQFFFRAVGPSLERFGVNGIADPSLSLFSGSQLIGQNDDWNPADPGSPFAFPLNADSKDAAFSMLLSPGKYTLWATPQTIGVGTELAELYAALSTAPGISIASVSSGVGDPLLAGIINEGGRMLVRGSSDSLVSFDTFPSSTALPNGEPDPYVNAYGLSPAAREQGYTTSFTGGITGILHPASFDLATIDIVDLDFPARAAASPVPEPASYAIAAVALLGAISLTRRRRVHSDQR